MANDPNRDLLPVREDSGRHGRGPNDKFDHQILAKLSRYELEDKFLRLLDEQTHIKKLANTQEEKIKRLGTKLLRLLAEKKNERKISDQGKESEELQLRLIELEHENYSLKDKNIVLKQQLASHSRQHLAHRSPARSSHTSPLMSMRQSAPPAQSEITYDPSNKNASSDIQLQEAEAHIRDLNEEIKGLHNKIDYLQQDLEKSSLDSRKHKVTENIELIRLQRTLKQQAIQIAALQAQVKNSEDGQKALKDELVKAHRENDNSLQVIAVKQNEILNLCSKLEKENLNRLEENELKERVNDLKSERDSLRERSEILIKTIGAKSDDAEKINELQKLLAEEKRKREELEAALAATNKSPSPSVQKKLSSDVDIFEEIRSHPPELPEEYQKKKDSIGLIDEGLRESGSSTSNVKDSAQESSSAAEVESDSREETPLENVESKVSNADGEHDPEKVKMEHEVQHLKEMLRSQTSRCEAQQAEITRLMHEIRLNEEKCNETLRKLDMHLSVLQELEKRQKHEPVPDEQSLSHKNVELPRKQDIKGAKSTVFGKTISLSQKSETSQNRDKDSIISRREPEFESREILRSRQSSKSPSESTKNRVTNRERRISSEEILSAKLTPPKRTLSVEARKEKYSVPGQKKRYVENTFLESSGDEKSIDDKSDQFFLQKVQNLDDNSTEPHQNRLSKPRLYSVLSSDSAKGAVVNPRKSTKDEKKPVMTDTEEETIAISILWFRIEPQSSLINNYNVRMLFVDFSFLDVKGEDAETPESLPKPERSNQKCFFEFTHIVKMNSRRTEMLTEMLNKPNLELIVFKVVSDSEDSDEMNYECEDVGVGVVTVKMFKEICNTENNIIQIKNPQNLSELVGILSIKIDVTPKMMSIITSI